MIICPVEFTKIGHETEFVLLQLHAVSKNVVEATAFRWGNSDKVKRS